MTPKKKRSPNRKSLHLRIDRDPHPPLQNFQKFLLEPSTRLSPSAAALGCLIGFELVTAKGQLPAAYASLRSVHLFRSHPHIRWVANEKESEQVNNASADATDHQHVPTYDERAISPFTMHSVLRTSEWKTFQEASDELMGAMRAYRTRFDLPSTLASLLASAREYAATSLSSAVRSHVVGTFRMVALDPASVVREATRKPLAALDIDMELEDAIASSEARLLHVRAPIQPISFADQTLRIRQESHIRQLVRACNAGNHLAPIEARKAVCHELAAVHSMLIEDDHLLRLFLLVALDMVQQRDLEMASIGRYFSGSLKRLFEVLCPLNFARPKGEEIAACITAAIAKADQSNKTSVKAVGQRLLHILARHGVVDEIRLSKTGNKKTLLSVRAQVIWPHEVDWSLDWLDSKISEGPQGPVLPAVRCAIGLLAETGTRITEALWLRLNALFFQRDCMQILINPGRSDRAVKSTESRRLVEITDSRIVNYVLNLLETRHSMPVAWSVGDLVNLDASRIALNEALKNSEAYLFGDPHHSDQIWEEVEVRKWIAIVLKQATGDVRSSPHDLRHTWTSLGNEGDFRSPQCIDPIAYDHRANCLGHSASDLMFTTYTHIFGLGIRSMVDRQLAMDNVLDMKTTATWAAGISNRGDTRCATSEDQAAVVQRAYASLRASLSRRKFKTGTNHAQVHLLEYLHQRIETIDFSPTEMVLKVAIQSGPPAFCPFSSKGISIDSILTALLALSLENREKPLLDEAVATQSGLTVSQTIRLRSEFKSICRSAKDVKPAPVLQSYPESWLVDVFWLPHFSSACSRKWNLLRGYLSKSFDADDSLLASEYVLRHMGAGPFLPAMPDDRGFASLVQVIRKCNLNTSALRLNSNRAEGDEDDSEFVQASLKREIGVNVPIQRLKFRSGRPSVYLSIRSDQALAKASKGQQVDEPNHDGRSYSMMGFPALFLGTLLKASLLREVSDA